MRYRGIWAEDKREKNKVKIHDLIRKNPDILLHDLIELAKPLAKDTVVKCVEELVNDGKETMKLLKKGMAITSIKRKYVIELKAGNRKIYRVFGLPLSATANQSYLLNQHRDLVFFVNYMETPPYKIFQLEQRIDFAKSWVLNPLCNILWGLITNDIENSSKNRFSKEIRECKQRIKKIFDIVKKDSDANKILPHLRATLIRDSRRYSEDELKQLDFGNFISLKDTTS